MAEGAESVLGYKDKLRASVVVGGVVEDPTLWRRVWVTCANTREKNAKGGRTNIFNEMKKRKRN